MSRQLVLDTTVWSAILKQNRDVGDHLLSAMGTGATILVSPVAYYEVKRGLLLRDARRMLRKVDELFAPFPWIEVTRGDWEEAAQLWAKTHRPGKARGDADILIAAQAKRRGAAVVTDNVKHFHDLVSTEVWS